MEGVNPATIRKRQQRKRLREELGDAEYRKQVAEKMKDYRNRERQHIDEAVNKANENVPPDDDDDDDDESDSSDTRKNIEKVIVREIIQAVRQFWREQAGRITRQNIPTFIQKIAEVQERVRQSINHEVSKKELTDLIYTYSKEYDNGRHKITKKTAKDYVTRLFFLERYLEKRKENAEELNLEFLKRTDEIIKMIMEMRAVAGKTKGEEWTISSKIAYLGSLVALTSRTAGFEDAYRKYSEIYNRLAEQYRAKRDENRITPAEAGRLLPWDQIVSGLSKVSHPVEKALYAIYVLQPPRRITDFAYMRVTNREAITIDLKSNWLLVDAAGNPTKFVFNRFKTVKQYGTQTFAIESQELKSILKTYLRHKKTTDGSLLFPTQNGTKYKNGAFSNLLGVMFQKYLGVRISVNLLRHSRITSFLNEKQHTVAEKKVLATHMAHSTNMQALYHRIEQNEDIDPGVIKEDDDTADEDDDDDDNVPLDVIKRKIAHQKKTKST